MKAENRSRRWRCLCAYDGTEFNGWQKQKNQESVQNKIEHSLALIFERPIRTIGAGRTDAGVHAVGQVFHFDAAWKHPPNALLQALRVSLPQGISPRKIEPVSSRFHAHLSSKGKRYLYRVCKGWAMPDVDRYVHSMKDRRLDFTAMNDAAQCFIGTHDFAAFSANRGNGDEEPTVRSLWRSEWRERGNEIHYITEGGGYLYKMVRSMVGAMLDVGLGRIVPEEISQILQTSQRTARVVSAPAKGLRMDKVFYRLPRRAQLIGE
jgi:tRNA pseudouridine38-40 synthase